MGREIREGKKDILKVYPKKFKRFWFHEFNNIERIINND